MKKLFALLLAIVMVFALGACGGESGGNGGAKGNYKDAINLFLDVKYNNAEDKIEELAPETFWEFYETTYNMPKKSMIDEIKYVIEQTEIELKDHFGEDYNLTPTFSEATEVSKENLAKISAAFEEQKGIKAADIKGAYEVTVNASFNNSEAWEEFKVGVIKIDGNWYCAAWDIYDEGTAVRFMLEEFIGG